jgi:hypothetical protein
MQQATARPVRAAGHRSDEDDVRILIEHRVILSVACSAVLGTVGLQLWPLPANDAVLALIAVRRPWLYAGLAYTYATLWFSTPFLVLSVATSLVYIFVARLDATPMPQPLPPYPPPQDRTDLFLILGEQHARTTAARVSRPQWLVIPERGLYTGLVIVGAVGTGKTSACMYPYVEQLLAYRASDPARKVGGLVLEVKGDFCRHVRAILEGHGRGDDFIEVSLESPYRYNPLHNDLDAYALAYGIATLMTNLYGRGKEPFWQQASTNLMKFVILLHQVLDDYVTLFQVYEHTINPDKLRARIAEGEERFRARNRRIVVDKRAHLVTDALASWSWHGDEGGDETWAYWTTDLEAVLTARSVPYRLQEVRPSPDLADRAARFEAVKRWFEDDWMRIEPKLRTSIVEGISVFLSLFDDNPRVKYTFCPPKRTYDTSIGRDEGQGVPLPPMAELVEQGKVIALNFPIAMNPGLARAIGTMLKHDFQRAVLNRIPKMSADPVRPWRSVFFVCDEYQAFATTGENEPSGDEKFFSLARQARCIPIVATQSVSSLRSTLPGESWRTLLQGLRTKVFLALSDDVSARMAADLCGKAERLKPGYTLTESGQDARVSMLTGRAAAQRTTVSTAKTYSVAIDYVFQPKVFAELQNAQAIVLPYDGINPQPPTYCYLKPYYLDT